MNNFEKETLRQIAKEIDSIIMSHLEKTPEEETLDKITALRKRVEILEKRLSDVEIRLNGHLNEYNNLYPAVSWDEDKGVVGVTYTSTTVENLPPTDG